MSAKIELSDKAWNPTARDPQPRCPSCGRFAYWHAERQEWALRCVGLDYSTMALEHE